MSGSLKEAGWLGRFHDRTVVVTGAGGFLGRRTVARLAGIPCRIVRVARTTQVPLEPPPTATVVDVAGDLRDATIWSRAVRDADIVIHFAAQTSAGTGTAATDRAQDHDANVEPMRQLLQACRQLRRRPTILFAGTVTQAGAPTRLPVGEDVADVPLTVYDEHKLMAERELERSVSEGTVAGATLRLANVYGPGSTDETRGRHVLNRMIRTALRGERLTVFGAGDYMRDYLFVDDAVEAFLMAGAHADRVNGRHYVVGSGNGITIRHAFELVAARVEAFTGRHVRVDTIESERPLTALECRNFVADPSRFVADTGWHPRWSLADGLDRTIETFACE